MNFSDMITRAFRTLRSGGLWGFVVTTQLAVIGLFVLATAGGLVSMGGGAGLARLNALSGSAGAGGPGAWLVLVPLLVMLIIAGLLTIPIALIEYGGVIHLTDEYQAGRPVRMKDGWGFGTRRMGRTFLVDFAVGLVAFAIVLVGTIPSVLFIVAAARQGAGGGRIAGAICGSGLLFLVMGVALVLLSGFEAIAIRYALIGGRVSGDSLGVGWTAFRARFKSVLLLLLILIGFGLLFGMAQSAVNYFLQFAAVGPLAIALGLGGSSAGRGFYIALLVGVFFVLYAIAMVMAILIRIFQQGLWTAFFRQMTGLEPLAQPAYQPPPPGTYYPAPYQPTAAWSEPTPTTQPAPAAGPPMAVTPQAAPEATPVPAPPAPPAPAASTPPPAPDDAPLADE